MNNNPTYTVKRTRPEKVAQAIIEAKATDAAVGGGDIPNANTSRVYKLWESIISNASLAQLRNELPELAELLTPHPPASPHIPRA